MRPLTLVFLLSLPGLLKAQQPQLPPRLVVQLIVDELRTDYLEALLPEMRKDGLARLVKEGLYCRQLRSPLPELGSTAAVGVLQTGLLPYESGITAAYPRVKKEGQSSSCTQPYFYDAEYLPYAAVDRISPRALRVPVMADCLKAAYGQTALVYALSTKAAEGLLLAGQRGDAAYWLDQYTGKWASSTYYKAIPRYLENYNARKSLSKSLPQYKRSLLYRDSRKYSLLPSRREENGLPPWAKGSEGYLAYMDSEHGVEELRRMILETLKYNTALGADDRPDLLSIYLRLGSLEMDQSAVATADAYYRLDRLVAELLNLLQSRVERGRLLLLLSGSGKAPAALEQEQRGLFYTDRCKTLLNLYLNPLFGREDRIDEISTEGEIYFKPQALERKSAAEQQAILSAAERFLRDFSGVSEVVCVPALLRGEAREELWHYRHRLPKGRLPEMILRLQEGWHFSGAHQSQMKQERIGAAAASPLFIYGAAVRAAQVEEPLTLPVCSATLAYVLRIRPPNPAVEIPAALMQYLHGRP